MDLLGALNPAQGQAQQEARKQAWTQQQIEYANEIARQLNQSSSDRSPIYSPWAGAARMADALVGGMTGMKALQMQRQNMANMAPFADTSDSGAGAVPSAAVPSGQPPSGDTVPRGIRNNNPGNIEDSGFAQSQPGYAGTDGRFARFDTPDHGMNATVALLGNYAKQGINTVNGVISKWAPASDGNNVSAYASHVAAGLGVDPNAPINLADPEIRGHIAQHIATFENGVEPMTRVAQANGWVGGGTQPQGSPQGAQNAPGSTQAAATPQTAQQPSVSQGAPQGAQSPQGFVENGTFLDPQMIQMTRPFSIAQIQNAVRTGQMTQEQAMQYLQKLTDPIPYGGGSLRINPQNPSAQMYVPNIQTRVLKDYGGKETPESFYIDSRGQMHVVQQAGASGAPAQGGTNGLYSYESTKAQAQKDVDRATAIQTGFQGAAEVGQKLKRYADELDAVANNPNFNVGPSAPLFQWAKKAGAILDPNNAAQLETLAPNALMKKVVSLLANEMTAQQSAEMREAGSGTGRVFQTNVSNALGALPDDPSQMTSGTIHTIAQTLRQGGDIGINENHHTQQFFKEKGPQGVRDFSDYMQQFRDPKNPNYDHTYDMPSGFSASAGAMPSEGETRKLSSGATAVFKGGQWVKQ